MDAHPHIKSLAGTVASRIVAELALPIHGAVIRGTDQTDVAGAILLAAGDGRVAGAREFGKTIDAFGAHPHRRVQTAPLQRQQLGT